MFYVNYGEGWKKWQRTDMRVQRVHRKQNPIIVAFNSKKLMYDLVSDHSYAIDYSKNTSV